MDVRRLRPEDYRRDAEQIFRLWTLRGLRPRYRPAQNRLQLQHANCNRRRRRYAAERERVMASRRKQKPEPIASAAPLEPDCYTIEEFCERHRISAPYYFKLKKQGLTPAEIRFGKKILITKEAAARWRQEREAASVSP